MAYATPSTQVTGYVVLAADWNEFVNNFIAMAPDAFTTDGDLYVASAADVGTRIAAFTNSTGVLKQEVGGIEADISAATTGDTIVGQSAGVLGLETAMSQAQAEAGTDTQVRGITAERVAQAIAALETGGALSSTVLAIARTAAAGSGDQSVTGAGFQPTAIIVEAIDNANAQFSIGFGDDGLNEMMIKTGHSGANWSKNNTLLIEISDGTNKMQGVLKTLDADGFTLTWTKVASGLDVDAHVLCLV